MERQLANAVRDLTPTPTPTPILTITIESRDASLLSPLGVTVNLLFRFIARPRFRAHSIPQCSSH
jgi:hypothetical protein